jgi:hypothetical protein
VPQPTLVFGEAKGTGGTAFGPGEAAKKWDWLRADTAKTLENQRSRRCLFQFSHSLGASQLPAPYVAWVSGGLMKKGTRSTTCCIFASVHQLSLVVPVPFFIWLGQRGLQSEQQQRDFPGFEERFAVSP